jgi:hypothetical protein
MVELLAGFTKHQACPRVALANYRCGAVCFPPGAKRVRVLARRAQSLRVPSELQRLVRAVHASSRHDRCIEATTPTEARQTMLRKILLACGVLASLLYVAADLAAAITHPEYHSFTARVVSELMARGAPTERVVDPFFLLHGLFAIAFGAGVWLSAADSRRLRVSASSLLAVGALDLPGPWLFEMEMRGTGSWSSDGPHIVLTGVLVALIMLAIGFAAFAAGPRFRAYSLGTLAVLAVFGALTGVQSDRITTGEPTPWIGLTERINIGAYLLWQAVLAVALLTDRLELKKRVPTPRRAPRADPVAAG